jgi:tetratricopeptide (TPR) repeat protein
MATDMVDFSALTHRDEDKALRLVEEHRTVIRSLLPEFEGREVKTMGDGFLIEFGSAVNATLCAIEIQKRLEERNNTAGGERIQIRIGLHVGDVVGDGDDILGDAVNIAARIEPLAEASGICISAPIRDQVHNKIPFSFTRLEHSFLKNIETPIEIYSIDLPWHGLPAARITPWTDRETELASLRSILSGASAGQGAIVAISGEPGIGKTRLAEEVIRLSKGKGFRTLRSRGFQGEPGLAYGHWVEAIRGYVREAPDLLLYKVCTGCLSQVVKLVPELAERIGPGIPTPQLDPGPEQLRLFEGIAQLFRNILKESPVIILLDDLQWADPSSLAVLDYLSREIHSSRLVLIFTYRELEGGENERLVEVLSTLRRHHALTEISLKRFGSENASQLVTAVLGNPGAVPDVAGLVKRKTGGNPLFVEELVRALVEEQRLVKTAEGWSVGPEGVVELPSRIRDVILQRVNRLDDESQDLLSLASVLPDRFSLRLLEEISGSSTETILRLTERMLRARIFRETEVSLGVPVYQFADDQIRETMYDRIALPRRQQYHLRVARALENAAGPDPGSVSPELAHHYYRGNDFANAVRFSLLAADQSASVYAREAAIEHYRRALSALTHVPNDRTRFEVLDRLGSELKSLGRSQECIECWAEAADGLERLGDRVNAGDLFRRLMEVRPEPEESAIIQSDLSRARENLEAAPPSKELGRFYLNRALAALWNKNDIVGQAFIKQALQTAELVHDHALEADIHHTLGRTAGNPIDGRNQLEQAIQLGLKYDPETAIRSYWELASILGMGEGKMVDASEEIERAIALAQKLKYDDLAMDLVGIARSFVAFFLGDIELCAQAATRGAEYRQNFGRELSGPNLCCVWNAELERGNLSEARRWEASVPTSGWAETGFGDFWVSWTKGRQRMVEGDLDAAAERFRHSLEAIRGNIWSWSRFLPMLSLSLLVDCSVRQGRLQDADRYLVEMRTSSSPSDSPAAKAYLARAEGLCARAHGNYVKAIEMLTSSIEDWERSGWKLEQGRAHLELARTLGDARRSEDALREVQHAEELFTKAGARPHLAEATALREALASGPVS